MGEDSETVKICAKSNVKIDIDMTKFDDFHDKQVLIVPNLLCEFCPLVSLWVCRLGPEELAHRCVAPSKARF